MKSSHLLICISKTGLSPESLAPYFGVSNMTLRRLEEKPQKKIPTSHWPGIYQGIYQLVAEGYLSAEDVQVKPFLQHNSQNYIQAVMSFLGLKTPFLTTGKYSENKMVSAMAEIGASEDRRDVVDKKMKEIHSHKKHGLDWKQRLKFLLEILKSKKLLTTDKLVAYGALFYLVTPFDFIPDSIPVFGLLDDFAVLGIASAYYLKNFSSVLPSPSSEAPRE